MKKILTSIASVIAVSLLAMLGLHLYRGQGPRERVQAPDGSKVVTEELSYYIHGNKFFGKIFRQADEDGNIIGENGSRPVVIYLHEPLKTDFPENVVKSLTKHGIIGYTSGFRGKGRDIVSLVGRIRKEKDVEEGLVFLAGDSATSDEVLIAASKLGHKIQGLILIDPNPTGKSREIFQVYGKEFLTIPQSEKGSAVALIEDYLEERGALK